jgi:Fe-S cluster assembly ATP-binding protein
MAILDEIDSGLDIDALRDVAGAVNGLKTPERSVLMVTHYRVRAVLQKCCPSC